MDFDRRIDRRNTDCEKWDEPIAKYGDQNIIPMWVADMDFAVAKPIEEAIIERAKHAIYGYPRCSTFYKEAFVQHFNTRCHHDVKAEEAILSTGVVYSLNACLQALTNKGDKVMIHSPAYPPFRRIIESNERVIVDTKMIEKDDRYVLDLEDMEKQVDETCKVFILCNPQNPTGRVFEKEELEAIAAFCEKHQLLILSDEIHADFIYDKKPFMPIMELNAYTKEHTITCVSCTKTFNLAGLNVSAVFIKNSKLREKVEALMMLNGITSINIFGLEAMLAAYKQSEDWLEELLSYLTKNREYALEYIKEHLPKVKVHKPEATYLLWMDMSSYHLDGVQDTLAKHAHVYVNDGSTFGKEYASYIRLNFACPKAQLQAALEAMAAFLQER